MNEFIIDDILNDQLPTVNNWDLVFPSFSKNLTFRLIMIVPGKFGFKIFFRELELNFDKVYSQSGIFFLKYDTIQQLSQDYNICSVTMETENIETFNGESSIIEFSLE